MDTKLSIIIPAYNEEKNIAPLYQELREVIDGIQYPSEIIFIDDGSTDNTFRALISIHEQDPRVKIIKFKKNFGQSAALKAGFEHASGNIVITMDSDLQNDPHDIPALIEKMKQEDYDVICGWRYKRKDSYSKKIFSRMANSLRILLTHESIHDSGCTLRAYQKESLQDIELYGELHRYIPAILQWKGYRIGELEVNHRNRTYGTTKYSWKRLSKGFLDLIVIAFWQKYSVRPMHIFGGFGFVLLIVGIILGLYLFFERIFFGIGLTERPLFLVGLLLIIVGIQFVALGILADILLKIYYAQDERRSYSIDKYIA